MWRKLLSVYCVTLNVKMGWLSKGPFPNLAKKCSTSFIFYHLVAITFTLPWANYPLNICLAFLECLKKLFC